MNPGAGPDTGATVGTAAALRVVGAIAARPWLWFVALRQASTLAEPGWWRRFPPLPVPPTSYLHFRLVTAYGGDGSCSPAELARDVVAYLQWCRTGMGVGVRPGVRGRR